MVPQPILADQSNSEESKEFLFSITPRFWYSFVNLNTFDESRRWQDSLDETEIPLYGGTIGFNPPGLSPIDFLFTGFYGEDDGRFTEVGLGYWQAGSYDVERLDLEALARYRIKGKNVSLYGGFRYIKFDLDLNAEEKSYAPQFPAFNITGSDKLKEENDFYLLELGTGFFANLTDDGRHRLFCNLLLALGYQEWEVANALPGMPNTSDSGFGVGGDINGGYSMVISQRISASLRYRAFIAPNGVDSELFVIHGPEVKAKD
jgi:hypothetical protein